jgi:drug/metabolite transporter (DMT)-like permease
MMAAGIMFVATSATVRHLSADMHFIQIAFFRSVFGIVCMMPWLCRVGLGAMRTRHSARYALRGVTSLTAMLCWFGALAVMPIADATSVSFATPIFISVAAVVFLHEPMRPHRWVGLIAGFVGTLIILRPGFVEINVGALMVLGSALFIAWSSIIVKIVGRDDRPDTIALYQVVYMLPLALVPALWVWRWPSAEQWFWAAMVGLLSTFAQRALTRSYLAADASAVAPFDFLRLPFATAIGFVVFLELPDLWTLGGGLVIFAASFYVGHGEAKTERRRRG